MGDSSFSDRAEATVSRPSDKSSARNSARKRLHDYPRPTVAVDTALLTWEPTRGLVVVQMWRDDIEKWALPGTFVRAGETLAVAVLQSLGDAAVGGVHHHALAPAEVADDVVARNRSAAGCKLHRRAFAAIEQQRRL